MVDIRIASMFFPHPGEPKKSSYVRQQPVLSALLGLFLPLNIAKIYA